MTSYNFFRNRQFYNLLWLAFVFTLAGCIVEPIGRREYVAEPMVRVEPAPVVEVGMFYYPAYEVYYDSAARIYWYPRGSAWVSGPAPEGVSVNVLLSSPNVRMDFRDSPANHHATVMQQYPRDWRPAGGGRGRGRG